MKETMQKVMEKMMSGMMKPEDMPHMMDSVFREMSAEDRIWTSQAWTPRNGWK